MIASVVAILDPDAALRPELAEQLAARPELEVGHWSLASTRIPITIDVQNRHQMEDSTTWLRTQPGILMVDVVFVHFEDDVISHSVENDVDDPRSGAPALERNAPEAPASAANSREAGASEHGVFTQ